MNKPELPQNRNKHRKTQPQLDVIRYEPAFYVELRKVYNMEEFQAGLQLAIERFDIEHSNGNELPHLHAHNETSKAAVRKFGNILFQVFNSEVDVPIAPEKESDYAD